MKKTEPKVHLMRSAGGFTGKRCGAKTGGEVDDVAQVTCLRCIQLNEKDKAKKL